jgi:hypothetical protein
LVLKVDSEKGKREIEREIQGESPRRGKEKGSRKRACDFGNGRPQVGGGRTVEASDFMGFFLP